MATIFRELQAQQRMDMRVSLRVAPLQNADYADQTIIARLQYVLGNYQAQYNGSTIVQTDALTGTKGTTIYGFLFEALVERDLKIYADSFNAKCYHYQDYQNKEIDSVIELENGEWGAFEIKLGAHQIEKAANDLLSLKKQIESENGKAPAVLCVICGLTNAAYQRPDGVYVVPITALKN